MFFLQVWQNITRKLQKKQQRFFQGVEQKSQRFCVLKIAVFSAKLTGGNCWDLLGLQITKLASTDTLSLKHDFPVRGNL